MITGIDHIVLLCPAIEDGISKYQTLLGRDPDWQALDPAGAATAFFQLGNMALELLAPHGSGSLAQRLQELLIERGPGLQTLVFASDDLAQDRRTLAKRALSPSDIQAGESVDLTSHRRRQWTRFRLDDVRTHGIRMFVLQRTATDPVHAKLMSADTLSSLDHLVINTDNPEGAAALYGARLGFNLVLDLTMSERNARLLSFKAGHSTIEIAHRVSQSADHKPDRMWGLTWCTSNIDAAHQRLSHQGANVSEIRQGMRKGTRVFTVRDGTLNVPTLILSGETASL
jgi:catechol 2,3-dioxygenase-like lactoylglutathione lyase family enzyme